MKMIDQTIVKNLHKAYDKSARIYNLRSQRQPRFKPGDEVFRRNFQLSDFGKLFNAKLAPKYIKARVHSLVGNNLYKLTNLQDKIIGVFHSKDLRV